MKDLQYQLYQLPGLARLFWMGESAGSVGTMIDSGPLAKTGSSHKFFTNTPFGANAQQPSHLLDQHKKKFSYCYSAGHVSVGGNASCHDEYFLNTAAIDNPNATSWSLVFAGLKLHDMSVLRFWHSGSANLGMGVAIDTDGTLLLQAGPGSAWTVKSSAGAMKQFVPQVLIVSYDHPSHTVTAYVGDWSNNFSTAISAAAATDMAIGSGATMRLGDGFGSNGALTMNGADGFLDALAVYTGYAITSTDAHNIFDQCGYVSGNTYARSQSHRNSVINAPKAPGAVLDTNSTAAASEYYNQQIKSPPSGAGSGGWNTDSNSIALYSVTKAYRDSLPTTGMMVGYTGYSGYFPGYMLNEDCPLPHNGQPSLGFLPSGLDSDGGWTGNLRARWLTNMGSAAPATVFDSQGGDHTVGIICPDTDEYWEGYQIHNVNTPAAGSPQSSVGLPVWSVQFGQKQSQFSLQWGGGRDTQIGCRATGIPVILGTPTISEQQAIVTGVPGAAIKKALTGNCLNAIGGQHKWPALRDDGTLSSTGNHVVEGMIFRFKQDPTTTARIQAMAYPIGRAWATAIQIYGHIPNDKTLYGMLMQGQSPEEYKILSAATNSGSTIEPYYQLGNGPGAPYVSGSAIPVIMQGASFTGTIMADAPWDSLEVVSSDWLNPMFASQPVKSAPSGMQGIHTPQEIHLAWVDDSLTDHWNVYQTSAQPTLALTSALSTGAPITSLPITPTVPIANGSLITTISGGNTQRWTLSAPAVAGVAGIAVVSQTPNFAYPTSSTVQLVGRLSITEWPEYTIWRPSGSVTLAVTAVNGGGESALSIAFTPPLPPRSKRRVRFVAT